MNPERINIKDLTIEEPEQKQEVFFDPEKEITREIKDKLLTQHELLKNHADWSGYLELCALIAIIGEKQKTTEEDRKKFKDVMWLCASNKKWFEFTEAAAEVKILGEEPWKDGDWTNVQKELDQLREAGKYGGADQMFLKLAANMTIAGHRPDLSESDWKHMYDALEEEKQLSRNGFPRSEAALHVRILGGKPELTKEVWDAMFWWFKGGSKETEAKEKLPPYILAKKLAHMTILAAEDVHVPEGGGLVINMLKPGGEFSESVLIPEQRNF